MKHFVITISEDGDVRVKVIEKAEDVAAYVQDQCPYGKPSTEEQVLEYPDIHEWGQDSFLVIRGEITAP